MPYLTGEQGNDDYQESKRRLSVRTSHLQRSLTREDVGSEDDEDVEFVAEAEKVGNAQKVAIDANGTLQAALSDLEIFDCPICLEQLFTPVFQCENGHIACSSCCSKVKWKCPFCSMPNDSRCLGLEKLFESIMISCKYARNGCEKIMSYCEKSEHEKNCPRVSCFCPHPSCDLVHSSSPVYLHFEQSHAASITHFTYNTTFSLHVERTQKQIFLQQKEGGVVFILNHEIHERGRDFYVDCVGPSTLKNKFVYQLTAEDMNASISLKSVPEIYTKFSKYTCIKNYFRVPSEFADNNGILSLSVCINKVTNSKLEEENQELWNLDSDANRVIRVVLTDPNIFDCMICLKPLRTPVFQCEERHLACSSCYSRLKSKCHCGCSYNRCRALEKVIESICRISCKYAKHGCQMNTSYRKKRKHERTCFFATCFCPHPSCTYADYYKTLYLHFSVQHAAFITCTFTYDETFSLCVDMNQKHIFLQAKNASVIFILNHQVEECGGVFDVDCVGTSVLKCFVRCQLTVKSMEMTRSLSCAPEIHARWTEHSPTKNYLTVPPDFPGYDGLLSLSVCINLDIDI